MSENIIGTGYNDPGLEALRSQVHAKHDNIPYLLLPVKIETRFMTVDRPVNGGITFPYVFDDTINLAEYMQFNPGRFPAHEVSGRAKKITEKADAIVQKLAKLTNITAKDKESLLQQANSLGKQGNVLITALGKLKVTDPTIAKLLRTRRIEAAHAIQNVSAAIEKIQPVTLPVSSPEKEFIGSLQKTMTAFESLGSKKLSVKGRKEQRQLFEFIDSQISIAEAGLKETSQKMRVKMTAGAGQSKKLDSLLKQFHPTYLKINNNLKSLISPYKRTEYSERLSNLAKKTELLQHEIKTTVIPKMKMLSGLRKVEASDILPKITGLRSITKRLNEIPLLSFAEIEAAQKKIFKPIKELRAEVYKVIQGTEEEFDVIKKIWDNTDLELEKFVNKIKTFPAKGNKEKNAINHIIQQVNNEYREDLRGLKSSSKSALTQLNNGNLEKSAVVYNQSIEQLKELNKVIEANQNKPELVVKTLEGFYKNFATSIKDIHILPQKSFLKLEEQVVKLESTSKKIANKFQHSESTPDEKKYAAQITATAAKIKETTGSTLTDSLKRKDKFTGKKRSPIVFSPQTITRDELWVRFYPDDIAIHTHEEALTQDEIDNGKAYWYEIYAAGEDPELKLAAWRAIIASYGSQRAAWIVKTMEPDSTLSLGIRDELLGTSKTLLSVNEDLGKLDTTLSKISGRSNTIEILGQAYPQLRSIYEKAKNIKKDNSTLLLKSQKHLLKIQSSINKSIKLIQQMSESERRALGAGIQVVNDFTNSFNAVVKIIKQVERITSKEIINGLPVLTIFPEAEVKAQSWTKAPHSRVMADRFAVITMRGNTYRHIKLGMPLPEEQLIVGIDPATFDTESFTYDEDGNLIVDENVKWLTDFNEAVNKGMAVYIPLEEEDVQLGFDKVFVLGVKNSSAGNGKQLLEDLIDNHHYIYQGASFLPVGTPTNNTEAESSGFLQTEDDASASFAIERNNESPVSYTPDADFPIDAERLAEGLGINVEVLRNLQYNDRTEVSEALTMNKALFYGTVGNHMTEGLDTLFTLDNINHTKAFLNNYVSARGFLPTIRIGTQPYGILPTTAFSLYSATANDNNIPHLTKEDFDNTDSIRDELQTRYDIRLKKLLNKLDDMWTSIRNDKVLYSGNTDPADPQAHFMQMLGLHAVSEEYFYRYGVNVAARQGNEELNINFLSSDEWGPVNVTAQFRDVISSGYYYKSDNFDDEQKELSITEYLNSKGSRISTQFGKARIFSMRHLDDQSQLLGDKVDNCELSGSVVSPTDPGSGNPENDYEARQELSYFIDWLLDQNPWEVHAENKFSDLLSAGISTGMPSKSLLFLFLRHSLLSAYADTILRILESEGLTDQETIKKMGSASHYYQRFTGNFTYVTKWTYLFSRISRLNNVLGFEMDTTNSFYSYMNSRPGSSGYLNRYLSPEDPEIFNNYSRHADHQQFIDELSETREAIRKLKDIPTQRLEDLLAEHLDLCTYRLDAWKLGMINKRLKEQRSAHRNGIFLGAYGWVEDLRKGGVRELATNIPGELWKSGDDPVYRDADNLGFIHTPSLNHAITAAILRAGFHATQGTAEVSNQMAVNLSSGRVRSALNLLAGIMGGQDAASLLGYQFERGLHERYLHIPLELDEYIYDFREEFPLSAPVDDGASLGDAKLMKIVNGIELLETAQDFVESKGGPSAGDSLYQSLKAFENDWWASLGNANISAANSQKKDAMLKEIDRMADMMDALGDLCISESIYQVAKGNHVRSSAIMDKLAKGDLPHDIEFANTPRTGTVVTHKVGLFINVVEGIDIELSDPAVLPISDANLQSAIVAANASAPGWNSSFTPRALAEPTLNKWVGEMIGDPAKIKCIIQYTIAEIITPAVVTLADLEVQPLDVLHLFGTGPLNGGAELNARIIGYVKKELAFTDEAVITTKFTERDTVWADDDYSFYEKAGQIQSIRELITNSVALAADDLLLPSEEEVPANEIQNLQVDELMTRITNLKARLKIVYDSYTTFFTDEISLEDAAETTFTNEQIDILRSLLGNAATFGIPGTIPETVLDYGNEVGISLLNAADGAWKAMASRLSQCKRDIETGADTSLSNEVRVTAFTEAAKKMLGKVFVVMPQFKVRNTTDISVQVNLARDKGLLRNASAFAMEEWSQSIARVRQRLSVLDTIQMWTENFSPEIKTFSEKKPLQFPFSLDTSGNAVDRWLGIEFPEGYQPAEDKLSIIIMNANALNTTPDKGKIGLLIDEWVEIIPGMNETTGITFNYDQPDAKAPNTILLAVTPVVTGNWNWDDLVHTLNDTLEMAKNRAVEPEHLEDTVFGQILPSLLTEVVPPQLLPAADDPQDNPLGLQVVTDFGINNDTYEPENEEL